MSFADAEEILSEFSEASQRGRVDAIATEWAYQQSYLRHLESKREYCRQPHVKLARWTRASAELVEARRARPVYPITQIGVAAAGTCPTCGARLERREGMARVIHLGPATKCARTGG